MTDFDPRFQPPSLDDEQVRASLAALAARTGILHPERAEWMIPGIIEGASSNMGPGPTITAWKNFDELLTAAEKRHLGINPRVKVCRMLAFTLTERGLEDINASLSAIFAAPMRAARPADYNEGSSGTQPQRLSAVQDSRTCAVALALHGTVFPAGTAPSLPLDGCDALSCRCMFVTSYPQLEARRTELLKQGAPDGSAPRVALKLSPRVSASDDPAPRPADVRQDDLFDPTVQTNMNWLLGAAGVFLVLFFAAIVAWAPKP
jgi:hypothetical protein